MSGESAVSPAPDSATRLPSPLATGVGENPPQIGGGDDDPVVQGLVEAASGRGRPRSGDKDEDDDLGVPGLDETTSGRGRPRSGRRNGDGAKALCHSQTYRKRRWSWWGR